MKRLITESDGSSNPKLARVNAMVSQPTQQQQQQQQQRPLTSHHQQQQQQHQHERRPDGRRQQVRETGHNTNRGRLQQKVLDTRDGRLPGEDVLTLDGLGQPLQAQQRRQSERHGSIRGDVVNEKPSSSECLLASDHPDHEQTSQSHLRKTGREARGQDHRSGKHQDREANASRSDGLEKGQTRHEQPQRRYTADVNVDRRRGKTSPLKTAPGPKNSDPQGTAYSVKSLRRRSPVSGKAAASEPNHRDVTMQTPARATGGTCVTAEDKVEIVSSIMNAPQQQQQQRRVQEAVATTPTARSSGAAAAGGSKDRTVRSVQQSDGKERQLEDDEGNSRRTRDPTAVGLLHGGLRPLPVNCPEKLSLSIRLRREFDPFGVASWMFLAGWSARESGQSIYLAQSLAIFVMDCGVETGLPCGQFLDGSSARVMDTLKKAIRLLASRRSAMNTSAQVGILEWGRTPRWRMQPHCLSSDSTSLETALDKLNPSTANEELCDINALLNTIREKTALPPMWDGGHPPFVVRAIVFYCRPTPPPCSAGPSRNAHSPSAKAAQGDTDRVATQSGTACVRLTDHPLFTLDAVFLLRRDACVKPKSKVTASAPTKPGIGTVGTAKNAAGAVQVDSGKADQIAVEQAAEEGVVPTEEQNVTEVAEEQVQMGEQHRPGSEAVMVDTHDEDNKKALRHEALQQAQSVFDWLHSVCTLSSYILPCAPTPFQVLQQCCRLLGHPLQRPPQHLAQYRLRPDVVRQLSEPALAEVGGQLPLPSSHAQMTDNDRESSTESSSTLSRLDDESLVDMAT
ncbi:hypothetical protein BIW11_00090 [Tropilaelaps mercedesae]|uniref:Uncharacterized protein n=1 Tax=Tropilaelaps mercedesae TaxID=418985 RepID=A0A1V9Y2C1_9ACAR|nr:hypothetical protein BIW11_00090 [Tropilaelaps mercedesae]